ncbi:MAG: hypothetical protein H0W83_18000 [Planctomycetes bacterium]|nr:hypothetical protein [Planctomycetota bacterium]
MPSILRLLALTSLVLLAHWCTAADDSVAPADPLGKMAEKQPPPAPAPAPAKGAVTPTVNTVWLAELRAFCAEHQWAIVEQGKGNLRAMLIAGATVADFDKGLTLGNQALDGLEAWTGGQIIFTTKAPKPEDIYWICIFATPDQVTAWIDRMRTKGLSGPPIGDDLMKKLLAFPGARTYFTHVAHIGPIFQNFAVYCGSCMGMDGYYQARGIYRGPTWMREGMAAELQRTLCQKILCTTIAYEEKGFPMSESWARDVAKLIKAGDRQVRPATELMRLKLDSLANVQYQQMWSLCSFVRSISGAKKGADNKFFRLIESTASGTDSDVAMKAIFKLVDPAFSKSWCEWAAGQK